MCLYLKTAFPQFIISRGMAQLALSVKEPAEHPRSPEAVSEPMAEITAGEILAPRQLLERQGYVISWLIPFW